MHYETFFELEHYVHAYINQFSFLCTKIKVNRQVFLIFTTIYRELHRNKSFHVQFHFFFFNDLSTGTKKPYNHAGHLSS